jgi:hypothetical protein
MIDCYLFDSLVSEHGLGDEGPGDLRPVVGGTATTAAGRCHVGFQA